MRLKKSIRPYTRRIAPGLFTARSHTRASRRHYIAVSSSGVATCSCEAYTYDKVCWAMRAVAKRLLRSPRERAEVASR
jgi:hypothetical protein